MAPMAHSFGVICNYQLANRKKNQQNINESQLQYLQQREGFGGEVKDKIKYRISYTTVSLSCI